MAKNRSPWISQLRDERARLRLEQDLDTDVVIIGAGIAGIATAFFALKNTSKSVVVLERDKLAHGATGHNAGQVVSYFERGFASLVDEFGIDLASEGQKDVEDAWLLLDEMYTDASLDIPFSRFMGHAGLTSEEQVLLHLRNNAERVRGGLPAERLVVADDAEFLGRIPAEYADLYHVAPRDQVLATLETRVSDYVAVNSYPKGVINSALFCQEVLAYLLERYPGRFALYEHTPANKVILKDGHVVVDAFHACVTAERVVLCTNGFEGFTIINEAGLAVDTRFRHLLRGTVGYMSGYLEPLNKGPMAVSYLENPSADTNESYFYLTRRPYEREAGLDENLISIGGPGFDIEDTREYRRDAEFPDDVAGEIDRFVRATYDPDPNKEIGYAFTWHGLMGYTRNGVRMVGPEPENPTLVYNLGCNGIGILPSLSGAARIARLLKGESLGPSIFDVPSA